MMPASDDLAGLVFTQVWQVTVVAAIAAAIVRLCCRTRPRLAYLLGIVVLMKCWVPPMWSSPVGVFCWPGQKGKPPATTPTSVRRVASTDRLAKIAGASKQLPLNGEHTDTEAPRLRYDDFSPESPDVSLAVLLGGVWLAGTVGLVAFGLFQNWRWRKRLRPFISPQDGALDLLTSELAGKVGLRRRPRVMISTTSLGPAVFGLLRPTIVLPASLVAHPIDGHLRMVLAHEMTHIRRGDLLAGIFQWTTQIAWWFHPLVWLTCRQLTRERERCCDEDVLTKLRCPPASYAQCLLDVLRLSRGLPLLPAFPGMRAVDVTRRRFEHIFGCRSDTGGHTIVGHWLLAVVLLGVVLPGAPFTSPTPAARETIARRPKPIPDEGPLPAVQVDNDRSDSLPNDASQKEAESVALVDDPTPRAATADKRNLEAPPELKQAIERGVDFLKAEQQADGHWSDPVGYPGGITALCTLALVRSGVKPDEVCVQLGVAHLRPLRPRRTYSTALQTMVLCAVDPTIDQKRIERNVDWLCEQQKTKGTFTGAWAYPEAEGDNSNTGFAMLALYEAEEAGVKIPSAVLRRALDHWVNTQNVDGSWGYKPNVAGTGSMTAQGLFCVAAATKLLDEQQPNQPGPQAIERATAWMARNFSAITNPGSRGAQGWLFYYLHAVAQAGRAMNKQTLGNHDWFAEGSQQLLTMQQPDGSWKGTGHAEDDPHLATSLALLFLAHGGKKAQ